MAWLAASIPSPSSGEIDLGPVQIHAYGLMLLLGIIAATWLTGRRWTGRWAVWRDPRGDLVFRVAMWGVLAGIVAGLERRLDAVVVMSGPGRITDPLRAEGRRGEEA